MGRDQTCTLVSMAAGWKSLAVACTFRARLIRSEGEP
jgi:hypothetical protein